MSETQPTRTLGGYVTGIYIGTNWIDENDSLENQAFLKALRELGRWIYSAGSTAKDAPSRQLTRLLAIMPAAIAMTNRMTAGAPVARSTIAGPGQNPINPQPMPKSTAPPTNGTSMSRLVGHWARPPAAAQSAAAQANSRRR